MLIRKLNMRGYVKGDSIVVMVVNAGEVDLFMNWACSCHHNNISISNALVFTGSADITLTIESSGAMAIHDASFPAVSRGSYKFYLDSIFADIMWYKVQFNIIIIIIINTNNYDVITIRHSRYGFSSRIDTTSSSKTLTSSGTRTLCHTWRT